MTDKPKPSASTVQNFIDTEELKRDVAFSDNAITDAYMLQAALYVDYAQKTQKAELQYDNFKLRLEVIEAQVDQQIRDRYAEEGRKITEAQLSRLLTLDKRIVGVRKRCNEAKSVLSLSRSALEAIKQKKDMLIQCGADLREEHKGQLRLAGSSDRDAVAKRRISEAM